MKLYLCGPINGRTDDDCINWREHVKASWGSPCIDPMRRDYRGREHDCVAEIVENDIEDIKESDALLVFFDKPSVGTSMEVFFAWQIGKPVYVINDSKAPLSPWLIYHSSAIFDDVDKALSGIKAIMHD